MTNFHQNSKFWPVNLAESQHGFFQKFRISSILTVLIVPQLHKLVDVWKPGVCTGCHCARDTSACSWDDGSMDGLSPERVADLRARSTTTAPARIGLYWISPCTTPIVTTYDALVYTSSYTARSTTPEVAMRKKERGTPPRPGGLARCRLFQIPIDLQ